MNKLLKITVGLVVLVIVVLTFYLEKESHTNSDGSLQTYSPSIKIIGRDVDTAYLFADYKDQGAEYLFDTSNALDCSRYRSVTKKTGAVNTRIPGVYYITYYADDILGNPITPQTRTVSVVENDAGFLNGAYDVSFSQTIALSGSNSETISAGTYTALITSASTNGHFNLYSLNIGPEKLPEDIYMMGDSLDINRFTNDYVSILGGGKLDRAAGSFTIETSVYPYAPKIVYKCRNVFTKQLLLNKQLVFTANSSKER